MAEKETPAAGAAKIGEQVAQQFAHAASLYGGAFTGTFKALQDYQAKLLHVLQDNTAANIQLTQKILQPRGPAEFVEFLSTHMRERAAAITEQAKELAALGQEAAKKAAESLTPPKS